MTCCQRAAEREVAVAVEVALHLIGELACGADAAVTLGLGRMQAQLVELGWDLALRRMERRSPLVVVLHAGAQTFDGEDLAEEASERVDIGAMIEVLAREALLGRHVYGRTDHRSRTRVVRRCR